jgi:UDP-N-acetyl-2-amino-2-deoxyglucuronate dehydrogenase
MIAAGLIGCGEVSRHYGQYASSHGDRFSLRAATELNEQAGLDFARKFGCAYEPSLERFLSHPQDLVCICAPNHTHAALATRAADAQSHVLVEHPLATTVKDANDLLDTADRAGVRIFVMRQRRFLGSIQLLRALLRSGELGRVRHISASVFWSRRPSYFTDRPWRQSPENGGVVMNQASHFLDLLVYLFGDPIDCKGTIGNIAHDIAVEDAACLEMAFAGDAPCTFLATTAAPERSASASLTVAFQKRNISLAGPSWETMTGLTQAETGYFSTAANASSDGSHSGYLDRVVACLSGASNVEIVDGEEGMRTVKLIEMIYRDSRRDNRHLQTLFAPHI